eukprot:scaffold90350_cov48-Prasinocladus_malaysianus.AAC.3
MKVQRPVLKSLTMLVAAGTDQAWRVVDAPRRGKPKVEGERHLETVMCGSPGWHGLKVAQAAV